MNVEAASAASLCISIGNTTLKAGVWDGDTWKAVRAEPIGPLAIPALGVWLNGFARGRAIVGSVVPELTPVLLAQLGESGWTGRALRFPELPIVPHRLATPQTTGIDRVCAVRAAWAQVGGACIVVDGGTAVTVNWVDSSGTFLGGAIIPGLRLWLESLHTGTAQLPACPCVTDSMPDACGDGTANALKAGAFHGIAGAVERLVREARRLLGATTPVLVTGGSGAWLAGVLDAAYHEHLVLDGIRLAGDDFRLVLFGRDS